jgi:hypothetical protein
MELRIRRLGVRVPPSAPGHSPLAITTQPLLLPMPPISRPEQLVNGVGGLLAKNRENVRIGQQEWIGPGSPLMSPGSLALLGWPSGGSRYGSVSTDFSTKDATAPFASSGAFGLVLHWPFFEPDVCLGPYPAK